MPHRNRTQYFMQKWGSLLDTSSAFFCFCSWSVGSVVRRKLLVQEVYKYKYTYVLADIITTKHADAMTVFLPDRRQAIFTYYYLAVQF